MKIAIIGFAREGRAVYKYYKNKGVEVWILDKKSELLLPDGALGVLGDNYLDDLDQFDLVYRSPGVALNKVAPRLSPETKLSSATKLFFELCPGKIIGVTGTKGKGTTCTIIYNILKAAGKDVYLVGNIGQPALEIVSKLKPESWVVYELSSFQLQDLDRSPNLAVVLDIFPDHQDAHKDYEEYLSAKLNIAKHQKDADRVFYFDDNRELDRIRQVTPEKHRNEINLKIFEEFGSGDLKIPGEHNFRNAVMAYAVARALKIDGELAKKVIFDFKGNEHRLELIGEINGVRYYNDSASTNPQTTLAAARSFKEPKILIVGGSDKGLDYGCWAKELPKLNIKAVILMGENREKIKENIGQELRAYDTLNLEEAVSKAKEIAVTGDVVLFSPGAASFDMFENYADRGRKFKEIVKEIKL